MPEVKVKLSNSATQILNTLSVDEGFGLSGLAEEIGLSEGAISRQVSRLRGLGLIQRHRNTDDGLLIYLSPRGENFLKKLNEVNPKSGGDNMAKFTFTVDDETADEIRDCAQSEDQSVSEFLSDLVSDALDEFYPESEQED